MANDNNPLHDLPPLIGEIAYVQHHCLRHPIIFTEDGWTFCRRPNDINPAKIIRDDVCTGRNRKQS